MKKFFMVAALMIAAVSATSCLYEEKSDVDLTFSVTTSDFSYTGSGDVMSILARAAQDPNTVGQAFTDAFNASKLEILGENHWVLRGQTSNKNAEKKAKEVAEKANASLKDFKPEWYDYVKATVKIHSTFGDKDIASYTYSK